MKDADRVAKLRADVDQRQQDKARASIELAAAQQREQTALQALRDEFGAGDLTEASELLAVKQADLDQACAEAEAALKEASGDI